MLSGTNLSSSSVQAASRTSLVGGDSGQHDPCTSGTVRFKYHSSGGDAGFQLERNEKGGSHGALLLQWFTFLKLNLKRRLDWMSGGHEGKTVLTQDSSTIHWYQIPDELSSTCFLGNFKTYV